MTDPRAIVDEQAKDPNLWRICDEHVPVTLHEELPQQALRRLHAAVEEDDLRPVIAQAIAELDAEHYRYDETGIKGCVICWPKDGGWPCVTRQVADDLRTALEPVDEVRRFRIGRHKLECLYCPGEAYCETWPVGDDDLRAALGDRA